ncbi:Nucleotide-binding, alpha-beta plait [Artemisia annua]|uniref:Nucleotide-binding, alpha-beta plait n=1 Tax=Artemisia annua TaxID=35608 RepID=A0A2U1PDG7_ARTAN|nr:Nucleotide-binding, alpha-beta plait [Artemisia annua]
MDISRQYEDPYAAQAAVEWFNNKDFHGMIIEVLMAESEIGLFKNFINEMQEFHK